MTIPKQTQDEISNIYKNLKADLTLCVKYHRRHKPEMVKEYFGTDNWEEIDKQLQVIIKPFSIIQKVQLDRLIKDLHSFYN